MIKFNKHNVTNTATKNKCRVFYSLDNRIDERKCVTLYAKEPADKLTGIFDTVVNNSDIMTDYFETDKVVLFEDHELYQVARKFVETFYKMA